MASIQTKYWSRSDQFPRSLAVGWPSPDRQTGRASTAGKGIGDDQKSEGGARHGRCVERYRHVRRLGMGRGCAGGAGRTGRHQPQLGRAAQPRRHHRHRRTARSERPEGADDDSGLLGPVAVPAEHRQSRRPAEVHAQRDLRHQRPRPGRDLRPRPELGLPRRPVRRHGGHLPQRRDLSGRPVDAVPGAQRRHLHGRHGPHRGAGGAAGHPVWRRRRGRRGALHHQ